MPHSASLHAADGLSLAADLCYIVMMSDTADNLANVRPSATPSEEDIRKWEALPRDEQLRRLRAALTHPDSSTTTLDSMKEVLEAARARSNSGG